MAKSPDHPTLTYVQARGYTSGRADGPPLWIVVHDMEAGEHSTRAENTAAYFANPGDGRRVSAHYCADDNSVVQCVRLRDAAWTVGNRQGNNRGINWEFSGFARQTRAEWLDRFGLAMFAQAAPIIRLDAAAYRIPLRRCTIADLRAMRPGVTSHNDLRLAFGGTTHTDPGPAFPWDTFLTVLTDTPQETDDMTPQEAYVLHVMNYRTEAIKANRVEIAIPEYTHPGTGQKFPKITETNALAVMLRDVSGRVDVEPAELDEIKDAARAGATLGVEAIVAGVLAGLPDGVLTVADVEDALRTVLRNGTDG